MANEPYTPAEVKRLVRLAHENDGVFFGPHALKEMRSDKHGALNHVDVERILVGGVAHQGEWENGCWRYQIQTALMAVVVTFDNERVFVVTAWRFR